MSLKKLKIYCDGGLGNRLNGLSGGLALSKLLNIPYEIYWPSNRMCYAQLEDILLTNLKVKNEGLDELNKSVCFSNSILVGHDLKGFEPDKFIDVNSHSSLKSILKEIKIDKAAEILIYTNSQLPPYLFFSAVKILRSTVDFKTDTIICAKKLLDEIGYKKNAFIALHMRGTDYGFPEWYFYIWKFIVKNMRIKTLLFTDDNNIKSIFSGTNVVKAFAKDDLPKKLDENYDWNNLTIDEYGRLFPYNIMRDEGAIKFSLVEMCAMSMGVKLYTSRSTFLFHAFVFQQKPPLLLLFINEFFYHNLRRLKKVFVRINIFKQFFQ